MFRSDRLAQSVPRMAPEELAAVCSLHGELVTALANTSGEELQALASRAVAEEAPEVSCRKGCAHCCYTYVNVTEPEATVLARHADKIDRARLAEQNKPIEGFMRIPYAHRRCVFLGKQDQCMVYEDRPMACRSHFVVSKPRDCDTRKGGRVRTYSVLKAEVLMSAARTVFKSGGMAQMLIQEFAK